MINCIKGDITELKIVCIVNAANERLLPGGGVCGAIHAAAGPGLAVECRRIGNCGVGEARITRAYDLVNIRHIIHTVGPFWHGGGRGEKEYLINCYENTLLLASRNDIQTIAFPNISTGIYGYPKNEAVGIAVKTVQKYQKTHGSLDRVTFCCFDDDNFNLYKKLL